MGGIQMKKLKKLYNKDPLLFTKYTVIGIVLIILVMAFIVFFIYLRNYNYDINRTYYNGSRKTIIITESMEPVIMVNGIVTIEPVEFDDVEIGDIIRFNNTDLGYSVCHRVIGKGYNFFITKGDNNDTIDKFKVKEKDLNGKVTKINNNYAGIISFVFGRFNINDVTKSLIRVLLGFIGLAIGVSAVILFVYWIIDIGFINYLFVKKTDTMQEAIHWLDDRTTVSEFNEMVERYKKVRSESNLLKRIWLKIIFRTYYDASLDIRNGY